MRLLITGDDESGEQMITKTEVDPRYIIDLVAGYYSVKPDDMLEMRRDQLTKEARQVSIYLICLYTNKTQAEVSQIFGTSTADMAHRAFNNIGTLIVTDDDMACNIRELKGMI